VSILEIIKRMLLFTFSIDLTQKHTNFSQYNTKYSRQTPEKILQPNPNNKQKNKRPIPLQSHIRCGKQKMGNKTKISVHYNGGKYSTSYRMCNSFSVYMHYNQYFIST